MDYKKDLLLASAARLYSIGLDLEAARAKLKELVALGVSYDRRDGAGLSGLGAAMEGAGAAASGASE